MFDFARRFSYADSAYDKIMENAIDNNDELKDAFLDDPDAMTIGSENDPKIAEFIESIPEDDDAEPVTNEDIKKITEGMTPYCSEGDGAITDRISSGNYSEYDEEIGDMEMCSGMGKFDTTPAYSEYDDEASYDSESDDAIKDRIASESYNEYDEEVALEDAYESEADSVIEDRITSGNYSEYDD